MKLFAIYLEINYVFVVSTCNVNVYVLFDFHLNLSRLSTVESPAKRF